MELHEIDRGINLSNEEYFKIHGTLSRERMENLLQIEPDTEENTYKNDVDDFISDVRYEIDSVLTEISHNKSITDIEDQLDLLLTREDLQKLHHIFAGIKKEICRYRDVVESELDRLESVIDSFCR